MTNAELYRVWLEQQKLADVEVEYQNTNSGRAYGKIYRITAPMPDEDGLFAQGTLPCVLPFLRVYWSAKKVDENGKQKAESEPPPWQPDTWAPHGDGFVRFFRADQFLDLVRALSPDEPLHVVRAIREALSTLLVPLDAPLDQRSEIITRRVETVRLRPTKGGISWSRHVRFFPDSLRLMVDVGLDPVHTPESSRAGLTRYLCQGFRIGDNGVLISGNGASVWGPSTVLIPHRLHDGPRRLMLGAALQARAVNLVESDCAPDLVGGPGWRPPGRNLRASFTMDGGWTHEDAVVVSRSGADKLARHTIRKVQVLVPSVASRVDLDDTLGRPIKHGEQLARAFVDGFAIGLRRDHVATVGAVDGWFEVALPTAFAPIDGQLLRVTRRKLQSTRWGTQITFEIERNAAVRIGDKLSTRHGIKGVVGRILPDDEMPSVETGRAEIVMSQLGIIRRGAMGQLKEADEEAPQPPHSGTIFVMRQPQDADVPERCRVRGLERGGENLHHGQRYGEMEFWALMAHDAPEIALELLSATRSTSSWMDSEYEIQRGDYRALATRALNRYLAVAGVQIAGGRLVVDKELRGTVLAKPDWNGLGDLRNHLDDSRYFRENGGIVKLPLGGTVRVVLEPKRNKEREEAITIDHLDVLPPWLRPASAMQHHPLTKAYWRVMRHLMVGATTDLQKSVGDCVRLTLDDNVGAGGFLKREVLGRRLTRSARAVIVPRPDLHVDQIAIPQWMADGLFEHLPAQHRDLVLVNRNPTLHSRGLLALRPVIETSAAASHVFGLPLGILRALGADFDGDQASVIALETAPALAAAVRLLPGASGLREDPFRIGQPAFPFAGELAEAAEENDLAADHASEQKQWSKKHHKLQQRLTERLGDGWQHPLVIDALSKKNDPQTGHVDNQDLWAGLSEDEWTKFANTEMKTILLGPRRKAQIGGILRRELYRRDYKGREEFARAVLALQCVTEKNTQEALSTKKAAGAPPFDTRTYFDNPAALDKDGSPLIKSLDKTLDAAALGAALHDQAEPMGLLAWLARPNASTLLAAAKSDIRASSDDPRVGWFLE